MLDNYLLVGFVNQYFTPSLNLGLLNLNTEKFLWITNNKIAELTSDTYGVNGIVKYREKYIVGYQSGPTLFVIYNKDFSIANSFRIKHVSNQHSFCVYQGKLLTVSTGFDEIVELCLDEKYNLVGYSSFWKHPKNSKKSDLFHINSIASKKDNIYITCFGTPPFEKGDIKRISGKVINIVTDQIIVENLYHPHSSIFIDENFMACESGTEMIFDLQKKYFIGGYTRGIAFSENNLYVGSSGKRLRSRSQGTFNVGWGETILDSRSFINIVSREGNHVEKKIDLSQYGNEIYELLYLKDFLPPDWILKNDKEQIYYFESQIDFLTRKIALLETQVKTQIIPYKIKQYYKKVKGILLKNKMVLFIWNIIKR